MGWFAAMKAGLGLGRAEPRGSIRVVDPSPLNWLHITYNTVEEPVRAKPSGMPEPAAMKGFRWPDERTLEVDFRRGNALADGEPLTTAVVARSFDEMIRRAAPHPPGTHFNLDPATRCEVVDDHRVRFHLPAPDGLAPGKLRGFHLMSSRFWDEVGFGFSLPGAGEGHW